MNNLWRTDRPSFWSHGIIAPSLRSDSIHTAFVFLPDLNVLASAEVLCKSRFADCESLASATFGLDSKFQRIEECGFQGSGLTVVHVPVSVEMLLKFCFSDCESLTSIIFEPHSKLCEAAVDSFEDLRVCVRLSIRHRCTNDIRQSFRGRSRAFFRDGR
jgi:hypothetical protein